MEIIHLRPLAQCEISGNKPTFLAQLFKADFGPASNQNAYSRLGESLPS